MDYKEYKESLSTTNGKGDDEYVVDTTEQKDIQSKPNREVKPFNTINNTEWPKHVYKNILPINNEGKCSNTNSGQSNDNISKVLESMNKLLQYKNKKYGNSALQPINVFSKESPEGSILIRLDDKLSRIKNSDTLRKNDISDIMGYLTLLCVSKGWDDFSEFKD